MDSASYLERCIQCTCRFPEAGLSPISASAGSWFESPPLDARPPGPDPGPVWKRLLPSSVGPMFWSHCGCSGLSVFPNPPDCHRRGRGAALFPSMDLWGKNTKTKSNSPI